MVTRDPVRRLTTIQQTCGHICRKALNTKKDGIILARKSLNNARKMLDMPLDSATPCRLATEHGETCSMQHDSGRTRYECVVEAHDSTRTRIGKTQTRDREDLFAEMGPLR